MSALPLPQSVLCELEHYKHNHHLYGDALSLTVLTKDPLAGRDRRFTVLRIVYATGITTVIGRELDIRFARAVARRGPERDGKPLTDAEIKAGKKPLKWWRDQYGYWGSGG